MSTLTGRQRAMVESLLSMYREGWFPMYEEEDDEIRWVQPEERGVIPLDERFRVSRSLRSRVRSGRFVVTSDRVFGRVVRECGASVPGREKTWLHDDIVHAFELLHRAGYAHSVEAWVREGASAEPVLVGGLYGLAIGGVFSGESMFSRPALGGTDASKVCLVHLVEHLRRRGFGLLDAQLTNEHLAQFGVYEMPREEYLTRTRELHAASTSWEPFETVA